MPRCNGGVIGPQNLSSAQYANGVWSLTETQAGLRGSDWPGKTKGLSASDPAISATEIYTTSGGTATNGTYYLNNVYTGNITRLAYCKFNVSSAHYQKWNPAHLTGYQDNGTFGATGTHTLSGSYDISADSSSTSTGWSWSTGTNTNAGGSKTFDTGLLISSVNGHHWLSYNYIASIGGGGWASAIGYDWQATADGTDYGSNYNLDWYASNRQDGDGAGRHKLSRSIWNAGGTAVSRVVNTTSSYETLWTLASDFTTNGADQNVGASGTQTASHYIGIRTHAWSDDGNNGTSYAAIWVHIPA